MLFKETQIEILSRCFVLSRTNATQNGFFYDVNTVGVLPGFVVAAPTTA